MTRYLIPPLDRQCALVGFPVPEREFRFDTHRRFRFDFCWPAQKLAAEVDGGVWTAGRHTRGAGYERDCEKQNLAVAQGWKVLRFTTRMVSDGTAIEMLRPLLEG